MHQAPNNPDMGVFRGVANVGVPSQFLGGGSHRKWVNPATSSIASEVASVDPTEVGLRNDQDQQLEPPGRCSQANSIRV